MDALIAPAKGCPLEDVELVLRRLYGASRAHGGSMMMVAGLFEAISRHLCRKADVLRCQPEWRANRGPARAESSADTCSASARYSQNAKVRKPCTAVLDLLRPVDRLPGKSFRRETRTPT